jgi:hypothetical protein
VGSGADQDPIDTGRYASMTLPAITGNLGKPRQGGFAPQSRQD